MSRALVLALIPLVSMGCSAPDPLAPQAGPSMAATAIPAANTIEDPGELWAGKLIRTSHLEIRVDDTEIAITAIDDTARGHHGYIADTKIRRGDDMSGRATLTVRVPSGRFDAALASFRQVGEVERESTEAQDVSKQYFDLQTRLNAKRATEERLQGILAERTGTLSDVLEVERELARVIEEIEKLEGERRFYDQQVSMSTITVQLDPVDAEEVLASISTIFSGSLRLLGVSAKLLAYCLAATIPWVISVGLLWLCISFARKRVQLRGRRAV